VTFGAQSKTIYGSPEKALNPAPPQACLIDSQPSKAI
jgi:hypothetical protein